MVEHDGGPYIVERLNGQSNYETWKFAMRILLEAKELWEVVDGPRARDGHGGDEEALTLEEKKAMAYLILAISPRGQQEVRDCTTPKKVWKRLESLCQEGRSFVSTLATTSRYIMLANTLLVMATFAGTLTFTVLLTVDLENLPTGVPELLGIASSLFLTSITGLFPVILLLQRFTDDTAVRGWFHQATIASYAIIFAAMTTAFFLLIIALHRIVEIAFVFGVVLLGISTTVTIVIAIWNGFDKTRKLKLEGLKREGLTRLLRGVP